jgi:cyclic pyranopterin phosphate synthase
LAGDVVDRSALAKISTNELLVDSFGRKITHLRLSVTSRCNLECPYCHKEGHESESHRKELPREMIAEVVRTCAARGITAVKITGGEPLLREDIIPIIHDIATTPGIHEVSLTTNGVLLETLAKSLKHAGLTRVNIGCDSFSSSILAKNVQRISKGLEAAKREGLTPIKLNMVVLKGINDHEIESMIQFAQDHGVILQLIELIETGSAFVKAHFISLEAIERQLASRAKKIKTRPMQARKQYFLANGIVEVVRSQHNREFCQHCNKIRVTSDGYLKPCLMRDDNLVSLEKLGYENGLGLAVERRRPFYD